MSQNDLSIANQGFPAFRSDLNSALQALGSTNSGTSAPSTTYANQLWYDTTNNILYIRNEDNDAWIKLFTLDQTNDNVESLHGDTIAEATSGSGVTIDSVLLKDGELGSTSSAVPIHSSSLNGGQFGGRRNIIINGAMNVAQRGTSATGLGGNAFTYNTVDRFKNVMFGSTAGRFTQTQESITDLAGFGKCLKFACTTADTSIGADELLNLGQYFEGQDLQHLKKGTSDAEKVTVSFYVKGNASATYTCELYDTDNTRHNGQTFDVTTSWNRVVLTFDGDTTGTLDKDNATSLQLNIFLHAGSTYTGGAFSSNTWQTTNNQRASSSQTSFYDSTSRTFFITGVQVEVGSVATPFESRSFGEELSLCQRYFQAFTYRSGGIRDSSLSIEHFSVGYLAPMRATPSLSVWDFDKQSHVVGDLATNAPTTVHYNTGGISFEWASTASGYRDFGYRVSGNIGLNSEL